MELEKKAKITAANCICAGTAIGKRDKEKSDPKKERNKNLVGKYKLKGDNFFLNKGEMRYR